MRRGILDKLNFSFWLFTLSRRFFASISLTTLFHFWKACRLFFLILLTMLLSAPFTLSPSPNSLSATSLIVLLGIFPKMFLSCCDLALSYCFFNLTSLRKFFHLLKASLGFCLIALNIDLIAPFTLSPSPSNLCRQSLKALLGIFSITVPTFCLRALSRISPFSQSFLNAFHKLKAARGLFLIAASMVFKAPFTLLPSPRIRSSASLTVLRGILSSAFFSLCDLKLSINLLVFTRFTKSFHLSHAFLVLFSIFTCIALTAALTLSPSPMIL